MTAVAFLQAVVGGTGYLCSLALRPTSNDRKQKFFTSVDTLLENAARMDEEGYDMYFALAKFTERGNRKVVNAAYLKSLFLDIDCGMTKPYATQADAVAHLRQFCEHFGIPKPTALVDSGRGLHVYWGLDEPLERGEWLVLASRLAQACVAFGLNVDPSRTEDAASVLRIPGTHNFKDDPAPLVKLFEPLGITVPVEILNALLPVNAIAPIPAMPIPVTDNGMSNLTGYNQIRRFDIIETKSLEGRGCAQIKRALEQPEEVGYEQWLDLLSIAKFCEDGADAIHVVSSGHSEYNEEETERIAASINAPHLCETFNKNSPGVCEKCPHKRKLKFTTPILLGTVTLEDDRDVMEVPDTGGEQTVEPYGSAPVLSSQRSTHVIPKYPAPYFRGVAGGVYLRTKDKEGDTIEVPIYRDDLYVVRRLYDPTMGPAWVFRVHTPREGVKDFTIASTKLTSKEDFRKEMGIHDIFLLRVEELMSYVAAWVNQLQRTMDQIPAKIQFGWTDDQMTSFVVGEKEYFETCVLDNPPSATTAQHFTTFRPKGNLESWKQAVDFYNVPGMEPYQYMVGTAFGSVLMAFTPIAGSIFHMHSPKSGFGKTASMLAAASVWGNPSRMVMKAKDTANSQWMRAETFKNLPLYVDELTNITPKESSDFAYSVTDANQKARMRNASDNLERVRGAPWSLIVGTTANGSLMEKVSVMKATPDGEGQRILEHRVSQTFYSVPDKKRTDAFSKALLEHYGHAGPLFIQYVMNNRQAVMKLRQKIQDTVDVQAGLSSSNRIWSAQVSCVVTGLYIAKKIGLVNYDIPELLNWTTQLLNGMRTTATQHARTPTEHIAQYYADNEQNVLRIRSTDTAHKLPLNNNGLDTLVVPDKSPRMGFAIRHEIDVHRLYLLPTPLRAWCNKHNIGYTALVDELQQSPHFLKTRSVRMGKGTRMGMPPVRALVLEWTDMGTDEVEE